MTILTTCPRCRRAVTDADAMCVCGVDLVDTRAFMEKAMQPSGGAPVLPLSILRKLAPDQRVAITSAIDTARRGSRPATRSVRPSRGLRFQLVAVDTFAPDDPGYVTSVGVQRLPVTDGVLPQMYVRAIWHVRAGETGTFEEIDHMEDAIHG